MTALRIGRKVICLLALTALYACSGGGSASPQLTGSNNVLAVVASGAPLTGVPFTVKTLKGTVIMTGSVGNDATLQAELKISDAPFRLDVTDTSVNPNITLSNLLLPTDFVDGKAKVNLTPMSTIVTEIVLNTPEVLSITAAELTALRDDAADAVKEAFMPLLIAAGVSDISRGRDLITKEFTPTQDPLDKVLDSIKISCEAKKCTLTPSSEKARISIGTLTIPTTTLAEAKAAAIEINKKITSVTTVMLASAPVVATFAETSQLGKVGESWAAYTGTIALHNLTDKTIPGGTEVYFVSEKLQIASAWNATYTTKDGKHLFKLPEYASLPPAEPGKPPSVYAIGYTGEGVFSAVDDLGGCNIGGEKCLVLKKEVGTPSEVTPNFASAIRSWVNFLATLPKTIEKPNEELPPPNQPPSPGPKSSGSPTTTGTSDSPTPNGNLSSNSRWETGFNGTLQLINTSTTAWTKWKIEYDVPTGTINNIFWGNVKQEPSPGKVKIENESWNGNLAQGKVLSLDFGAQGYFSTNEVKGCLLSVNGGAASPCVISITASTSPTATPTTPPAPPPAPPASPASSGTSGSEQSAVTGSEPTTVAASVKADQTKRVFAGYYPSWTDNWFSAKDGASDDQILVASKFARAPGSYTHLKAAFAQPDFLYSTAENFNKNVWTGTGLNFNAGPQEIKRAIDVLHARNIKVLLAVGGATYNNWAALAQENGRADGPITNALKQVMIDVGFDGLDIDYEVDGIKTAQYTGAVNAMRQAVDSAGRGRWLTLAGWSTGADDPDGYWGGKAGGERLVFSQPGMAAKIDMVSIMSYDARFEHYDGVRAWKSYRSLFPARTIVNIGLETAPEGWAGGMLVIEDADAQCTGSMILQDQYGKQVNEPYSVNRYASAPKQPHSNSNARDGAMLWQVLKTATGTCGNAKLASPGTITQKISDLYSLPKDNRTGWQ